MFCSSPWPEAFLKTLADRRNKRSVWMWRQQGTKTFDVNGSSDAKEMGVSMNSRPSRKIFKFV
jgi:hypothetical protein